MPATSTQSDDLTFTQLKDKQLNTATVELALQKYPTAALYVQRLAALLIGTTVPSEPDKPNCSRMFSARGKQTQTST